MKDKVQVHQSSNPQSANSPIHQSGNQPKAVVIGAGISGLAVAIRLAVKGYEVKVFERNATAGGKISKLEKDGYYFDSGPSLFTWPQGIEELFALANEPIDEYFNYRPVPIACRYFFENGKKIDAYTDKTKLGEELKQIAGEDPSAVCRYLTEAERAYKAIGHVFMDHSLHKNSSWLNKRIIPALSATRLRYLTDTLHRYNQRQFRSVETIQIFDRFATYSGSDPFHAPAMLSMISHLELNEGIFFPEGGMKSIPGALYKLAKNKGVQFIFDTCIEEIVHKEGKVSGVIADGNHHSADLVISDGDVYYVYRDLLKDQSKADEIVKKERSSSAIIFYWGMNKLFPELHLHNIFFSNDYRKEFRHLFNLKQLFHDPTIYINITSKMEADHAPKGGENWFVMVNAPDDLGQDWNLVRQQVRKDVIEKLNRNLHQDITRHIKTETVQTPRDIQTGTLSHMGSLYGASSNSIWSAFLKHPNFSSQIRGLFFTGGTVHPGGGIPLCLKSAKIVASLC